MFNLHPFSMCKASAIKQNLCALIRSLPAAFPFINFWKSYRKNFTHYQGGLGTFSH